MPKTSHLKPIVDGVIQKFTRWKGHTLCFAGQCGFVNSVIVSSLVHTMMMYKWPTALLKKVETIIRNYLWIGDITRKKANNVKLDTLLCPVDKGGFGVRSICLTNVAFTCKLTWDIMSRNGPSILRDRYFTMGRTLKNFRWASSVWSMIHRYARHLHDESL